MALVNCVECDQKVSSQAEVCPHCGLKKPGHKVKLKSGSGIRPAYIIAALLVVVMAKPLLNTEATTSPAAASKPVTASAKPKECSSSPFEVLEVGRVYKSGEIAEIIDQVCPTSIWKMSPKENITVYWQGNGYNIVTNKLPYNGVEVERRIESISQVVQ